MPQMAPLSWVFLFFLFILLFSAASTKLYFSFSKINLMKNNSMKSFNENKILSWVW